MLTARTTITTVLVLGLALAAYLLLLKSPTLDVFQLWTASLTGFVLQQMDSAIAIDGTIIASQDFAIQIVAECTIFGPILLYAAAVMVYPSSPGAKIRGLLLGAVILTVVNTVRMISLFFIGAAFHDYLETAHLLIWQPLLLLLTIALWLWWAAKFARVTQQH